MTTTATPVPERSTTPATSTPWTVPFACLAMLVSYLPFSGVNGILGRIAAATGAATRDLQWLAVAFVLPLAVVVLSAGVLASRYGPRRVARAGLALAVAGSVLGFGSAEIGGLPGVRLLWSAQAVCGIGAGAVMSSTLALLSATAADARARTRAISLWAAAVVAGLGAGPFLAGAVSERTSYAWYFPIVAVVVGAVGWLGRYAAAPTSAARPGLDLPGQITGAAGIAGLITAVIEGGAAGWTSVPSLAGTAVAVVGLTGFIAVERRSASPLLRPELFASGAFAAAGIAAMSVLFCVVGMVFVLSLYFSSSGAGDLGTATRLGILFAANAAGSVAAAPLRRRHSPRAVLVTGLLVAAAGAGSLTGLTATTTLADLAWRLAVLGAGSGAVMATCSAVAVESVPGSLAAIAGAANNALRQTGAALGPAVLGAVLTSRLRAGSLFPAAIASTATVVSVLLAAVAVATAALLVRRGNAA